MSKKDYLLKVLDVVMDYFPLARGLKILITQDTLDDVAIDTMIKIMDTAIQEVNDAETKRKLQKSRDFLEKLKSIEEANHIQDEKSIAILDKMIETL